VDEDPASRSVSATFKVGAALTGSGFHVVMANGAQARNVFWSVGAAVTLSTSTLPPLFQGNILAGNAAGGSVTITGGSLIGRVLANVAVTMTGTNTHGSCALLAQGTASCTADNDVDHHDKDKDQDHDKDRDKDKDKDHEKEQDRDRQTETAKCLEAPPVPCLQLRPRACRLLLAARSICLGKRTTGFRPIRKSRPRRSCGTQTFKPRRAITSNPFQPTHFATWKKIDAFFQKSGANSPPGRELTRSMKQSIRDDFFLSNRLHKPLHRTNPHVPNHPHFTHTARLHPLVNPAPAKHGSVCGTEGLGFKSRCSPQTQSIHLKIRGKPVVGQYL
jgi:Ice-binding-like